jgi:hypothetical protein
MSVVYLNSKLAKIAELVGRSAVLLGTEKTANNAEVMHLIKTANAELAHHFARQALTGLGIGAGVALPAVLSATYLMNQAAEKAKIQSEELFDKITRMALGAAGIGAGIYALSKITNGGMTDDIKQAAFEKDVERELMHKVATCVVVDEMLAGLDSGVSSEAQKLAEEIRQLNNGYLVALLKEVA